MARCCKLLDVKKAQRSAGLFDEGLNLPVIGCRYCHQQKGSLQRWRYRGRRARTTVQQSRPFDLVLQQYAVATPVGGTAAVIRPASQNRNIKCAIDRGINIAGAGAPFHKVEVLFERSASSPCTSAYRRAPQLSVPCRLALEAFRHHWHALYGRACDWRRGRPAIAIAAQVILIFA